MAARGVEVDYRNVQKSQQWLDEMLRWSDGKRKVPVIVQDGTATVGWNGGG